MKWSQLATIFLGVLLIAVITPLSQFLTIATVNADVETATPVAWAVGLVFSFVLIFAFMSALWRAARFHMVVVWVVAGVGVLGLLGTVLGGATHRGPVAGIGAAVLGVSLLLLLGWWTGRNRALHQQNMVILYVMLSLAAPLMNLGLIRPAFLAMTAVTQEYVYSGTDTYRTAYSSLNANWFPLVPTNEGLAWGKADRLMQMMDDSAARKARSDAEKSLAQLLKEKSLGVTPAVKPVDPNAKPVDPNAKPVDPNAKPADPAARVDAKAKDLKAKPTGSEVTPEGDKPSTGKPASDKPTADKPGTDKPTTDKPGTDKPGTDKPGTDKPTDTKPAVDKPTGDKPVADKPVTGKPADPKFKRTDQDPPRFDVKALVYGKVAIKTGDKPADPNAPKADPKAKKKPLTPEEMIALLGIDELERILGPKDNQKALQDLGLMPLIQARKIAAEVETVTATQQLPAVLATMDEFPVSLLPPSMVSLKMERPMLTKLRMELSRLDRQALDGLKGQAATLTDMAAAEPKQQDIRDEAGKLRLWLGPDNMGGQKLKTTPAFDATRKQLGQLSKSDWAAVRVAVQQAYLRQYAAMPRPALDALRQSYVYRLNTKERQAMMAQDGSDGTVKQNVRAFEAGLWNDLKAQAKDQKVNPFTVGNAQMTIGSIPWHIWATPMVMWGTLFALIFMLMMCLAEWLRRKWIERENLAFPLVEIADQFIRHDSMLEAAEDVRNPEPRPFPVNPIFVVGFLIGAVMIFFDAMGYYNGWKGTPFGVYDVSKNAFAGGTLRDMTGVAFVLSPIVVGIGFLVSLELTFSIWVIYALTKLVFWFIKLGGSNIQDSIYTGWAGGRLYPFPLEQLLGAALCFAVILMWKSTRKQQQQQAQGPAVEGETFIPRWLNTVGLIVLPLAIGGLLWNMGIRNIPLLLIVGVVSFAQLLSSARVRAESGLPTQHASYEFTRLPLVFGLTGMTGAQVYAAFSNIVFLPTTLLFRTLPQHLENLELARRHKLNYRTVAVASLVGFITALVIGLCTFLVFSYFFGNTFFGEGVASQGPATPAAMSRYPLWVSHFLGEDGLDKLTQPHTIRILFIGIGFAVFGALALMRGYFLSFPISPVGYMLVLLSVYYEYVSPYFKGDGVVGKEDSWLWGSVFVAWLLKKLVTKYGGMNAYKHAKPFFIGLVVGAVVCVFCWNITDLACSIMAQSGNQEHWLIKLFTEKDRPPFSPRFY